ncbi:hypothetical protein L9F63_012268, partial [Diploptera punctata]
DLPEIKGNHRKFRTLVTSYIALKHSPSKRKSISRPVRGALEAETGDGAGSPTGASVAPPCATSTPIAIPTTKPPSPPVVTTSASPPSYPAVLKDRPPSFVKSLPTPGGAPSSSGKIPPPVPPRGSPMGKRGDAPRGGNSEKYRMTALEQHGRKLHDNGITLHDKISGLLSRPT